MINALGLLEVEGMVAAVDAADAMLKAANVRLLSHEVLDPGRLTLVVEGDLAAHLKADPDRVNVKATTEEGLGFTGAGEGMAAHAVCLLERMEQAGHMGRP